ncbi:hypothetical protein EKD04_023145 [Chloroflexales bacterium ZM16-3]|nr:hypothetical protein [Chloroflexales bacterium ZM16-3]
MLRRLIIAIITTAAMVIAPAPAAQGAVGLAQPLLTASIPAAESGQQATLAQISGGLGGWLPALAIIALLITMGVLVAFAVSDWRSYQQRGTRRGYRPKRTAHERFAAGVDYQRRAAREGFSATPPPAPHAADDEDELLRQLLGQ